MGYPDYPLQSTKSYLHHSEILKYINSYVDQFHLLPYVKFHHHLTQLTREQERWKVTVQNLALNDQESISHLYDIVVLCPGRFWIPYQPEILTLSQFQGKVIHSRDYRSRDPYSGQRVAVIGASASGADICMELSTVAAEVILLNRTEAQFRNLPSNVRQVKGEIVEFDPNSISVRLLIETTEEETNVQKFTIDSVIFATGFRLNLAFLDQESCELRLNPDDTLDGVYRHFVNIRYPSMALLSVIEPSISFPLYHQQVSSFSFLSLSLFSYYSSFLWLTLGSILKNNF